VLRCASEARMGAAGVASVLSPWRRRAYDGGWPRTEDDIILWALVSHDHSHLHNYRSCCRWTTGECRGRSSTHIGLSVAAAEHDSSRVQHLMIIYNNNTNNNNNNNNAVFRVGMDNIIIIMITSAAYILLRPSLVGKLQFAVGIRQIINITLSLYNDIARALKSTPL